MVSTMTRNLLRFAAVTALLFAASPAHAEDSIIGPSTNPMWAALDLGPSIATLACGSGGCSSGSLTQFKLTQEFGYHTGGTGEGFAIGAAVSEAFGDGLFRFQPGLRMWGDIPVGDDLGLYITPMGHLGYGLLSGGGSSAHAFNPALGIGMRMVLADVAIVSFSPATFDFLINDDGMVMAYELSFGGGLTF
jgi:hypothetical protein